MVLIKIIRPIFYQKNICGSLFFLFSCPSFLFFLLSFNAKKLMDYGLWLCICICLSYGFFFTIDYQELNIISHRVIRQQQKKKTIATMTHAFIFFLPYSILFPWLSFFILTSQKEKEKMIKEKGKHLPLNSKKLLCQCKKNLILAN